MIFPYRGGFVGQHVVIAVPDDVIRVGLCSIFGEDTRVSTIYEAITNEELLLHLKNAPVDLVMVDQTLEADFTMLPDGNFVLLAAKPDIQTLYAAYEHGARGYLSIHMSKEILRIALKPPKGAFVIDPILLPWLMQYVRVTPSIPEEASLTERQKQVDSLVREGLDKHAIAAELSIAYSTVKTHMKHISQKRNKEQKKMD
jgi:DNA-binding NarL/FixJ family response regulator